MNKTGNQAEAGGFRIRNMQSSDISRAFNLSFSEGWNQTRPDWEFLLNNPGNTCIVAEYGSEIIGTATAMNHSGRLAWIGMVLVDKRFRGQGAGRKLMTSVLSMVSGFESVRLDATPAGEPLYRSLGFAEEYRIWRMTCPSVPDTAPFTSGVETSGIREDDMPGILDLDRSCFGVQRENIIRYLLKNCPGRAMVIRGTRGLLGYILGRNGSRFSYTGPLCASSDDAAITLLARTLELLKGKPAALDVSADKEKIIGWLESSGFVRQRYFVRMCLEKNPFPDNPANQYLISGPEYG